MEKYNIIPKKIKYLTLSLSLFSLIVLGGFYTASEIKADCPGVVVRECEPIRTCRCIDRCSVPPEYCWTPNCGSVECHTHDKCYSYCDYTGTGGGGGGDFNAMCIPVMGRYDPTDVRSTGVGQFWKSLSDNPSTLLPFAETDFSDDVVAYYVSGTDLVPGIGMSYDPFPFSQQAWDARHNRSYGYIYIPEDGQYQFAIRANQSTSSNPADPVCWYCAPGASNCIQNNGGANVFIEVGGCLMDDLFCDQRAVAGILPVPPESDCDGEQLRIHPDCKGDCRGDVWLRMAVTGVGSAVSPLTPVPLDLSLVFESRFEGFSSNFREISVFSASVVNPVAPDDGNQWFAPLYYRKGWYPIQMSGGGASQLVGSLYTVRLWNPQLWWQRVAPNPFPPDRYLMSDTSGTPGNYGEELRSCMPGPTEDGDPDYDCAFAEITSSNPNPAVGDTVTVTVNADSNFILPDQIQYSVSPDGAVSSPNLTEDFWDAANPYTYNFTILVEASPITIGFTGIVSTIPTACEDVFELNSTAFIPETPWWQGIGGDIIAVDGGISSYAESCSEPPCEPPAELYSEGGDPPVEPGIPILPSVEDILPPDNISETNYNAKTAYNAVLDKSGNYYDYEYFCKKVGCSLVPTIVVSTIDNNFFIVNSGDTSIEPGYKIFRKIGDLNTSGDINLGNQKVILFVEGNFYINGKINLNDGAGFFMVIATGDIVIADEAGHSPTTVIETTIPDLEGLFLTDKQFITGPVRDDIADKQLFVRGGIIGLGDGGSNDAIDFQRDLIAGNSSYPAEVFKFAPDLLMRFPSKFGEKDIDWQEVAP